MSEHIHGQWGESAAMTGAGLTASLGAHLGNATVHAEPFESLALELGPLWER